MPPWHRLFSNPHVLNESLTCVSPFILLQSGRFGLRLLHPQQQSLCLRQMLLGHLQPLLQDRLQIGRGVALEGRHRFAQPHVRHDLLSKERTVERDSLFLRKFALFRLLHPLRDFVHDGDELTRCVVMAGHPRMFRHVVIRALTAKLTSSGLVRLRRRSPLGDLVGLCRGSGLALRRDGLILLP